MAHDDGDDLAEHMARVQAARRDLRDLGLVWQMIESSAAISCPEEADGVLPTLLRTRERFGGLQNELITAMSRESRAALGDQLAAKAQCAIDILVRNLFERTADVGFLSTDDVVRAFCAAPDAERQLRRAAMQQRLHDYQSKYTVYDDIALIAPDGRLLARLDEQGATTATRDPIVAEALAGGGYVERFRPTDLAADGRSALLYAHRIDAPGGGGAVGVLVLRFRFLDEMRYVFSSMEAGDHEIALVLLDEQQQVIVSSDDAHVPHGARLSRVPDRQVSLTHFAGREYLAVACASPGYQGYAGPPWRAQAMVSLLTAFRASRQAAALGSVDEEVPLDNTALRSIGDQAVEINRDLRRVVWNGQLRTSGRADTGHRRLKAVLQQVEQAGRRTRQRVDLAIRELHRTSLARAQSQVGELARLAMDILDRNLYERANDCRWWALSPALQRLLAAPADAGGTPALNALLDHVNGLYTVYSRLVAFDAAGRIRGASRLGGEPGCVGEAIDREWLEAAARLTDAQRYHVSRFGSTALHDAGDTWVYIAAVRGEGADRPFLGGIAIVFHAQRELVAMLGDVLGDRTGVAAYCDADGRVLVGTDPVLAGHLSAAALHGGVAVHDGVHYACARIAGLGYREFKKSDGYDNGVTALVALRLGAQERRRIAYSERPLVPAPAAPRERVVEAAVFQVGATRCAISSASIVEALDPQRLVRTPASMAPTIGMLEVADGASARMVPVVSARDLLGVPYPPRRGDGVVLVLRSAHGGHAERLWGLMVDDVLSVIDVADRDLQPPPDGLARYLPGLTGMLRVEELDGSTRAGLLIQLLEPERIAEACGIGGAPALRAA